MSNLMWKGVSIDLIMDSELVAIGKQVADNIRVARETERKNQHWIPGHKDTSNLPALLTFQSALNDELTKRGLYVEKPNSKTGDTDS